MAKLYKANGEVTEVTPKEGTKFGYEELKSFIGGGWLEIVPFTDGRMLVCDEEGKLKNFPMNEKATDEWKSQFGNTDIIVGDVLIANEDEIE